MLLTGALKLDCILPAQLSSASLPIFEEGVMVDAPDRAGKVKSMFP
jgi:hypothetical protein